MQLSIPIALLLGVIVLLLIRKGDLKAVHAVVAILFGFLLAATAVASRVGQVNSMIVSLFGGSLSSH